mmetsp:Transcript_38101/g.84888  ORF Transcript_38101/g.84888 Transcript_38101/m.84888 type:complete len:295 (+) Transcript_38101:792-1676(+)
MAYPSPEWQSAVQVGGRAQGAGQGRQRRHAWRRLRLCRGATRAGSAPAGPSRSGAPAVWVTWRRSTPSWTTSWCWTPRCAAPCCAARSSASRPWFRSRRRRAVPEQAGPAPTRTPRTTPSSPRCAASPAPRRKRARRRSRRERRRRRLSRRLHRRHPPRPRKWVRACQGCRISVAALAPTAMPTCPCLRPPSRRMSWRRCEPPSPCPYCPSWPGCTSPASRLLPPRHPPHRPPLPSTCSRPGRQPPWQRPATTSCAARSATCRGSTRAVRCGSAPSALAGRSACATCWTCTSVD